MPSNQNSVPEWNKIPKKVIFNMLDKYLKFFPRIICRELQCQNDCISEKYFGMYKANINLVLEFADHSQSIRLKERVLKFSAGIYQHVFFNNRREQD